MTFVVNVWLTIHKYQNFDKYLFHRNACSVFIHKASTCWVTKLDSEDLADLLAILFCNVNFLSRVTW